MSNRLDALKASHPELCFICGCAQPAPFPLPEHICGANRVIAALVAALEEAEKEMWAAKRDSGEWFKKLIDRTVQRDTARMMLRVQEEFTQGVSGEMRDLRAQLTAAEKAHTETKAEYKKVMLYLEEIAAAIKGDPGECGLHRLDDLATVAAATRKALDECENAWGFYLQCKADSANAHATGAMKDAHDWVFKAVEKAALARSAQRREGE